VSANTLPVELRETSAEVIINAMIAALLSFSPAFCLSVIKYMSFFSFSQTMQDRVEQDSENERDRPQYDRRLH
jgi:hypothetical protein